MHFYIHRFAIMHTGKKEERRESVCKSKQIQTYRQGGNTIHASNMH
jgi:hypothetical protein